MKRLIKCFPIIRYLNLSILFRRKIIILYTIVFLSDICYCQTVITGIVKNKHNIPVFAANVYFESDPTRGTTTNFEGYFSLNADTNSEDFLLISYMGYKTERISVQTFLSISKEDRIFILEDDSTIELNEVITSAQSPISKRFSISKIEKYDIYMNPISEGDPLKAISLLPSSTNTEETSAPSLRGSPAEQSIVAINGVPIYNPANTNNLNRNGFISIFNSELINSMYVHASNPPLTYGNTTAGLVEVQTTKDLDNDQTQLSLGLGGVGFLLSKNIVKDISFVQVYSNYQFSDFMIGIQKKQFPEMKSFVSNDVGINFNYKITEKIDLNSYSYLSKNKYKGIWNYFSNESDLQMNNNRFFSINNMRYFYANGALFLNLGTDVSNPFFKYANIYSRENISNFYVALNNKLFFKNFRVETGLNYNSNIISYNDSVPLYYYAIGRNTPTKYVHSFNKNKVIESFFFIDANLNKKTGISLGLRYIIPYNNQKTYLSSQLNLKYDLNTNQSIVLGIGRYHSYLLPKIYFNKYNLITSNHLTIDYNHKFEMVSIKGSVYSKNENSLKSRFLFSEPTTASIDTKGLEISMNIDINKYLRVYFSNSFIHQILEINEFKYKGAKNMEYLTKFSIIYNNPRILSIGLNYSGFPGGYYDGILNGVFDNETGYYKPIYDNGVNYTRYSSYSRFDLSINKLFNLGKNSFILYGSIYNLFNKNNEKEAIYNYDYSIKHYTYYQNRMIYFGLVWSFAL